MRVMDEGRGSREAELSLCVGAGLRVAMKMGAEGVGYDADWSGARALTVSTGCFGTETR